jgi:methylglyoxal synthase
MKILRSENMRIALIAHDKKKDDMIDFAKRYKNILERHELFGTGTTGKLITEQVGLQVSRFLSGPLGGDQQIGAKLAQGELDMIIFLRDPLTVQPHEPDISALLRLCDVHCVPLATNLGTAEVLMRSLKDREY